jgi:hypothetical protein
MVVAGRGGMWSSRSHALGTDCLPGWQAAQGLRLQRTAACENRPPLCTGPPTSLPAAIHASNLTLLANVVVLF